MYKLASSLALMFALSAAAAPFAMSEATSKDVSIPVFFITDRNMEPGKIPGHEVEFGPIRQYLAHCKHDPHMGVASGVIDNFRGVELNAQLQTLGWKDTAEKEGDYTLKLINLPDFEKREAEFYRQILAAAQLTPDKEVEVFVPGYMSTFRSGTESAARFAYYSKHPVVLYSWASKGSAKEYSSDEASVEWSQPHFDRMIDKLTALSQTSPGMHFRIYSHSIGNRLVLRAALHLRENHAVTEIAMICPDLDDGVSLHYLDEYASPKGTTKGRLYTSRKDRMLVVSQLVHGGYLRFGEQPAYSQLLPTLQSRGEANPDLEKQRFQSIDFTALDEGRVGHKIPVALVCAMSNTGKPPKGLKLMESDDFHETKAAKFLSKTEHLHEPKSVDEAKHLLVEIDKNDKPDTKYYKPHRFVWQTIRRKDWSLK